MQKIISSNKVVVFESKIPNAGRGVFATQNIGIKESIEVCPIIDMLQEDIANLGETVLATYLYFLGKKKQSPSVVLGFGSIYNHSYSPNATYKIKLKEKTIEFISLRHISRGEEITVSYLQGIKREAPLWFEE